MFEYFVGDFGCLGVDFEVLLVFEFDFGVGFVFDGEFECLVVLYVLGIDGGVYEVEF